MSVPSTRANLDELQRRFSLPGLHIGAGNGGLPRVAVRSPLGGAEIYLHGAHVTHFQPAGASPLLFMSQKSLFAAGKAIRGGIPVIFPWFGPKSDDPSAPMHGFARTTEWSLAAARLLGSGIVEIEMTLSAADVAAELRRFWSHEFALRLIARIGKTLEVELEVSNLGQKTFGFQEALHTYFAVGDVRQVSVSGLAGAEYISKVEGGMRKTQDKEPIRITGETDRVYLNATAECALRDPAADGGRGREILVGKTNSRSTVVWNPWIDKAKAMADFGDDEWPRMICIETCNALENAIDLAPGAKHTMTARIGLK